MYDDKNDDYTKFNQDDRYDLGKWLYGVDDSQVMPEGAKAEGKWDKIKKSLSSPAGIYLAIIAVILPIWFIRTLVVTIRTGEAALIVGWLLSSLFALFVCELILIFSVFGLWGKFMRFAVRKGVVNSKEAEGRRIIEQVEYASGNVGRENAFTLYENYVVVKNAGKSIYVRRSRIKEVKLVKDKFQNGYAVVITLKSGGLITPSAKIPVADAYVLPDFLGDCVKITDVAVDKKGKKKRKRRASKYDDGYFDEIVSRKSGYFDAGHIGGLIMGLIAVAAGVGVIIMHYYVAADIPIFLGAFFIMGGVLVEFAIFDVFPIVSVFFIPFLFGLMFTVFPSGICFVIFEGATIDFMSFFQFLEMFSPVTCVVFMLTAIGLMLLLFSFVRLVKYVQYKTRNK